MINGKLMWVIICCIAYWMQFCQHMISCMTAAVWLAIILLLHDKAKFHWEMITKKVFRETQTLRAGCSKTEPKNFAPPQTPFPGVQDGQNLISWRWSLPSPTNRVWWGLMHAILSYRGNRPTNSQTNPQTGPITIHCAAKLSAQCNERYIFQRHYRFYLAFVIMEDDHMHIYWSLCMVPVSVRTSYSVLCIFS